LNYKKTKELEQGDIIHLYGINWVVTKTNAIGGAGFEAISKGKIAPTFMSYSKTDIEVEFIRNAFDLD
jgi:hypothetical protein